MRDLETPPFITGDLAYGAPAPGGFANAGAVPNTYPADTAYTAPSLGGEFQPGQSGLITTKGAPADGGQALLAALHNAPPAPVTPVTINAAVAIATNKLSAVIALDGGPTVPVARQYVIALDLSTAAVQSKTINVAVGETLAAVSAKMRSAIATMTGVSVSAIAGSAQIEVVSLGGTIDVLTIGAPV